MSPSPRLFCLDTVMIDIVLRIDAVPAAGSDVLANEQLTTTGGGYNAMSAASRQGMAVSYGGRLGVGPLSTLAREDLSSDGIAEPIEADPAHDAGFCVTLVDDAGERTFITAAGAETTLRPDDLASLDVRDGDFVLISGYNVMYRDQARDVLAWTASLGEGVVVAFDPAIRVAEIPSTNLDQMLARADWVLCNETEAQFLSGVTPLDESVDALLARGGRRGVVVRHGATGATFLTRGGRRTSVAAFATTVVDTNGAGDTHNGVFLAELARGTNVEESVRRGNAAAALAIATLGPASCPSRDRVTELLASIE